MSYIGRDVDNISNVEKLDNITFDGGTTYALEKSSVAYTPSGANNILISIDGVVQQGNFSVSTTNIVFDWSPTSSNTCDWILHYGTGLITTPADGSVSAAKMAANSVDSDSYVDGSIDTAHIDALQVTGAKLNTDVISAQTELASAPADADEFMVSDGGVLKRIDYSLIKGGTNTPMFHVNFGNTSSTSIANDTGTKMLFDTESFDTDNCYDPSTNYRFTPNVAGKYFFYGQISSSSTTDYDNKYWICEIKKNGTAITTHNNQSSYYTSTRAITVTDMNGSSDYVECFGYQTMAASIGTDASNLYSYFGGYKLIS